MSLSMPFVLYTILTLEAACQDCTDATLIERYLDGALSYRNIVDELAANSRYVRFAGKGGSSMQREMTEDYVRDQMERARWYSEDTSISAVTGGIVVLGYHVNPLTAEASGFKKTYFCSESEQFLIDEGYVKQQDLKALLWSAARDNWHAMWKALGA
jgi:hypothetical protein